MIRPITQAKVLMALAFSLSLALPVQAEAEPNAADILHSARVNQMSQEANLNGQLRVGSQRTPFVVNLASGVVRYQFEDPKQEIQLQFSEKEPSLTETTGESSKPTTVNPAQRLRDTSITYEDLALQFLYWPNPKIIGDDNIRTRSAWKIEIQAPRKNSQYGVARLWIDKQSGALLKIEGYDKTGRLAKRFEVISAQKIEGQWMLRTMRVEEFDPATRKVTARTYLEIKK